MLTDEFKTTREFWNHAVATAPDSLAAVHLERRLTYSEADVLCTRLAAGLQKLTGKTSPAIAVCLPNCLDYFLLYWALVKIGGIIIPVNPWLKADSLVDIFATVSPDALVVQGASDQEPLEAAKTRQGMSIVSIDSSFSPFQTLFIEETPTVPPLSPEAPSIIMHTSGTTSAPKGAVMRHCDLIFNVMTTITAQGFIPSDIHLIVNPMFHCTALYSSLPAAAAQCTPVIITAETQPEPLLKLIQDEHITTFLTVPAILQRIVALPSLHTYDVSSLRVIGYAGSFMPVKTVRQLQTLFPDVELHNFFGLTETISATHAIDGQASLTRPDSIGRLLPFVEAITVDENLKPCPPNQVGELLFARKNVIQGYWGKPGKLEESLVTIDGKVWFRTGDLALIDDEGYAFIKGRKKDMIIVGGENVFASEVEAAVMLLDDVKECSVIGVPATGIRESLGELIKLFVVKEDGSTLTEATVRRHCFKTLPSYKIPHIIQFIDALPRNPSGKVVKTELH
ncbi:MAG: AMP-binding protein [Victivallales bacterium]|nr:AMP-binding protein [Victivallales bacterium]